MSMPEGQWPERTAVLRRCRRCAAYRSIDQFVPLGKLCQDCVPNSRPPTDRHGVIRGMAITAKGRAALAEMREEVAV